MYICIHVDIYIYILCVCMYIYNVCVHGYIHVSLSMYVYIYTYTHILQWLESAGPGSLSRGGRSSVGKVRARRGFYNTYIYIYI